MNPVHFPEARHVLARPASMTDEECAPLPIMDAGDALLSCWEPTDEERQAIAAGAPVWLWVFGRAHPPVSISAASPFVEEPR